MKSFVIYLTIFFVVTTYIRGFFGLDRYKFYENPYLKEKLQHLKNESAHITTHNYIHPKFVHTKKFRLDKPAEILDYSSILGTKLQPIEQKYLQLGIKQNLAKDWFSKDPTRQKFKLILDIQKHDLSTHRYLSTYGGKRHYRIDQKSSIKIHYKVINSKCFIVAKGLIPYNVIVKAASYWDHIESERLAKKRLYLRIGQKIANSLNSKRFYIFEQSNIAKL